jgi:hypothetical protein
MKVISLLQPWASLVAIGAKKIETRSWSTKYRGPLAIHASKRVPLEAEELCLTEPFQKTLEAAGIQFNGDVPLSRLLPTGAIIATCRLVDCREICLYGPRASDGNLMPVLPEEPEHSFGDYTPGRYAWILGNVKTLHEPIPAKGRLGLWEFDMSEHIQCIS